MAALDAASTGPVGLDERLRALGPPLSDLLEACDTPPGLRVIPAQRARLALALRRVAQKRWTELHTAAATYCAERAAAAPSGESGTWQTVEAHHRWAADMPDRQQHLDVLFLARLAAHDGVGCADLLSAIADPIPALRAPDRSA